MFFSINYSVPVLFGDRVSLQTASKLKEMGLKKVLCVFDKDLKATGIIDPILNNLRALEIQMVEYDAVIPDPPDTIVDAGGELGRQEQVDCILGIGGGSSLDTAKGINILMTNNPPITNYFSARVPQKPGVKLVLIPTTSGTGSEVTTVSVITNTGTSLKRSVSGANCTADLAIVDPHLTIGLPPRITAFTGMDAFAHALEAYTSIGTTMMSDVLSEKAIELISRYLPRAVREGSDLEARTQMSFASTIAGYSFSNAYVHIGHAIAHTLGALAHVPHGIGCAIAAPPVVQFVAGIYPERIRRIGEILGLELKDSLSLQELAEAVMDGIRSLNKEIGIPTLKELGVRDSDLPEIARVSAGDSCCMLAARRISANDVLSLLEKEYAL